MSYAKHAHKLKVGI